MILLTESLNAWNSAEFRTVLKRELEQLDPGLLPLQEGLSLSSHVLDEPVTVIVLAVTDTSDAIQARAGVFYSGVIAGCNCADDPTPVEAQIEYCEIAISIDKATAGATFLLVAE
jgi:hypothetical protein